MHLLPQVTLQTSSTNSAKLTPGKSNPGETKVWKLLLLSCSLLESKIQFLQRYRLHCSRRSCKKFLSPRQSINKSREANSFIQHDKVEASKLRRYLETSCCALNSFYNDKRPLTTPCSACPTVRGRASVRERVQ